jgi:hypothetical protein
MNRASFISTHCHTCGWRNTREQDRTVPIQDRIGHANYTLIKNPTWSVK